MSRSRLPEMVARPLSTAAWATSIITTLTPDTAQACAMPLPIVPAPMMPTVWIVMRKLLEVQKLEKGGAGGTPGPPPRQRTSIVKQPRSAAVPARDTGAHRWLTVRRLLFFSLFDFGHDHPRHPPFPLRHPRDAARLRRTRQGGADRPAAPRCRDHRG